MSSRNRLLRKLSEANPDLLQPHLEPIRLNKNDVCIEPGAPITHVYFLEGGLGSTVISDEGHGIGEFGMQGYEGLIGVPVLLGEDQAPVKTFMAVGGPALRMKVEPLRVAMEQSTSLHCLLLLYAQVFLIQVSQTAYANAHYKLEKQLARWVLMAADRLGSGIELTHEALSFMLGVRRPGVTEALHVLEEKRLIKCTRGNIEVLDRAGLKTVADQSYGLLGAECKRLIGPRR